MRVRIASRVSAFDVGRAPLKTTLPAVPAKPRTSTWPRSVCVIPRSSWKPGTRRAISSAVLGANGAKYDASYGVTREPVVFGGTAAVDPGSLGLGVCAFACATNAVAAILASKMARAIRVPLLLSTDRLGQGVAPIDAGSINRRTDRPEPLVGAPMAGQADE